ncbi:MAG TPA: GGDEF domain-containing protein [Candidatus Saccharimonadales bacterium]|nr:GGDEF domain-containing protein [Candidatus Saccharimonadales bacterium]
MSNNIPLVGSGIPVYSAKEHEIALGMNEGVDIGRNMAEIDEYGIRNSGGFRREGPIEVAQAQYSGEPLGLVMTDLDGLKAINDELGHPEGDKIINRARSVWRDIAEESEVRIAVGRVGGDEFAAIVHGDAEQTRSIAEEFEKRYRGYVEDPKNEELRKRGVTTSIGYANLSDETNTFAELMRKADERMYVNKIDKLGELRRRDRLALLAARGIISLFTNKRLRDAPKYWRKMGVLD